MDQSLVSKENVPLHETRAWYTGAGIGIHELPFRKHARRKCIYFALRANPPKEAVTLLAALIAGSCRNVHFLI